jgi:hypothetical protein
MGRGLWFLAGTAAGVYTTVRARRAAESLTRDGVHDRLQGWFAGARVLRDEVVAGRTEKETELRARLALVPHESNELTSGPRRGPRPLGEDDD